MQTDLDIQSTLTTLGMSLGLGLLVGLQRQRVHPEVAGFRTFGFVTVFGTLCALLAGVYGGWILGAGVLGIVTLLSIGNLVLMRQNRGDPGMTTEIAAVTMFGVGAALVIGPPQIAVAVGAGVGILLQLKQRLHSLAETLSEDDLRAIMRLALISCIVLPLVPDESMGPYDVLNPYHIWLMVVLIVGIGLAGYIALKLLGSQKGAVLAGVLGGVISSTATTASFSRKAQQSEAMLGVVLILVLAAATMHVRVMIEISAVGGEAIRTLILPIAVIFAVWLAVAGFLWMRVRKSEDDGPNHANPAELRTALAFGAAYAIVLVATAAAKDRLGDRGLYAVAAVSGLVDMDAITLSTARMAGSGRVEPDIAWRVILLAGVSNAVFKSGIVLALAGFRLFWRVGLAFLVPIAVSVGLILLWPSAGG